MSGPSPLPIVLSEQQQAILNRILGRHTSSQRLVRRAAIILKAAIGQNNEQIAQELHINRNTVIKWRQRWCLVASKLLVLESKGIDDKSYLAWIERIFSDEPRSGAPAKFETEQVVQIVALACELEERRSLDPEGAGLPITHWTPKELATEAIKRGIVQSISPRSVERFLKGSDPTASSKPLLAQLQP